jgi:cobalt-zinc-cadmium efflux system outer membrane protein
MIPLLVSLVVSAAPVALSFDDAIGLAPQAPRVEGAARALSEKSALDSKLSSLTLNPTLSVMPGYRLSPTKDREPELVAELTQPWNLAGHSGARRSSVRLEEAVVEAEMRARALEQRLAAARAWVDLWAAQRVFAEMEREAKIADELQRLVERTAALGAATRADVADARAFAAEARLAALNAEGEVHDRGLELAREVASPRIDPIAASGDLPSPPLPVPIDRAALVARAAELPDVARQLLAARAERARGVEERAARGTILQLGVALQRDAPGGLVVSGLARITPPLFDRGERERGVRAAEAARLEGEQRAGQLAAQIELAMTLHEVEHTAEVRAALRDRLVPASREGADARRRIFAAGEATLPEVLQSERTAIDAESRLQRASAMNAWSRIKLWLLLSSMQAEVKQ